MATRSCSDTELALEQAESLPLETPPGPSSAPATSRSSPSLSSQRRSGSTREKSNRRRTRTVIGSTNRPHSLPSSSSSSATATTHHVQAPVKEPPDPHAPPHNQFLELTGPDAQGVYKRYSILPEVPAKFSPLDTLGPDLKVAYKFNFDIPEYHEKEISATWLHRLIMGSKHWKSEAQASYTSQMGQQHPSQWVMDKLEAKKTAFYTEEKDRQLDHALRRLRALAKLKFGSVSNLFKVVGLDQKSHVTLFQLSKAFREANLEVVFPRALQRIIFESMPWETPERARQVDLEKTLEPPGDEADSVVVDDEEKERLTRHSTYQPEADQVKVKLSRAIVDKCRAAKLLDDLPEVDEYLMNAFALADHDMRKSLKPEEIVETLGPKGLNLNVDKKDLDVLLATAKKTPDGRIKYEPFVRFLELTRSEPNYDPLSDMRQAAVMLTEEKYNQETRWDPQLVEAVSRMRREKAEGARLLALAKQTLAEREQSGDMLERPCEEGKPSDFTRVPPERFQHSALSNANTEVKPGYKHVTCGKALFQDMDNTNAVKMRSICPRIIPGPPTDWTRVGYGGDGIQTKSGLYLDNKGRFTTSNAMFYPPIAYEPNKPPARTGLSLADQASLKRRIHNANFKAKHEEHIHRVRQNYMYHDYSQKMQDEGRIKAKTGQHLQHLTQSFQNDFLRGLRTGGMARRQNKQMQARVFGGSPDQQFNIIHKTPVDDRQFTSLYMTSFKPPPQAPTPTQA